MAKVSVLVAVYNGETTLRRCLDSLLSQTHGDIEVLCVDDCSTDNSASLLDEYARRDNRIKVFRQPENRGQAVARNRGLAEATGDYVCFLDCDDRLSADALEKAVGVFESHRETDCVLLTVKTVEGEKEEDYPMSQFEVMTGYEAFVASLTWKIHGCYVTRTTLHKQFPYDDTCRSYSDDNTTRTHYYHSREVRCCEGVYYYYKNELSVTHKPSVRRFDYIRANESMKKQLVSFGVGEEVMRIYEKVRWLVLVDTYMFYFLNRKLLPAEDAKFGLNEMKRVWTTIETARIEPSLKRKFGYMPMRFSWKMFRLQEEIYFTLKKLTGRI
ncbi:MAG: glycosyltransferase [Prevotella sp.]|uniref:glycosyltransferase family 2 protein n=1 Tax=Prevotella sp. TaxID=59823 RepID=UPI002A282F0E|nr:glycosyltransferase [Prevotella sp.]MDD7319227.1 glycosyltransferase [Prevotellaceae bacterium]MDY4020146.1 glycosyltransferase [Prevotella sp.]